MTTWVLWRLLKFVALTLFAGGVVGAVTADRRRTRLALAYAAATPGFVLTAASGWMLMRATHLEPTEPWIIGAVIAAGAALDGAYRSGHRRAAGLASYGLAFAGLAASVAVMVGRTLEGPMLVAVALGSGLVGAAFALPLRNARAEVAADDAQMVHWGFRSIAWAEGVSAIVLLLITTPMKYTVGIDVDQGTGVIGWIHGLLVIVYLQSLVATGRAFGWSPSTLAMGAVASLIPGGTFLFEARARFDTADTAS